MATKKRAQRKKNSLVENINCRKRTGTTRPKSRSTVSRTDYEEMQRGWPKKKKNKVAQKKSTKRKSRRRSSNTP